MHPGTTGDAATAGTPEAPGHEAPRAAGHAGPDAAAHAAARPVPPDTVPDVPVPDAPPPPGTWLLFGGPYSNLQATRAVLDRGAALGIPPERILCTGDVAAYCADPAAVAALLHASGVHVLRGNCEERLAAGADDCGCGFTPGSSCDRLSAGWYAHALSRLDPPHRLWMRELPPTLRLACGPRTLLALHGAPGATARFVFASEPDAALSALLDAAGADGVVGGHCGLPFTRLPGGRAWHNPGVVGMPANDGTPRTWFSLLEPHPHALVFRHRALRYDHAAAAAAMRRDGMAGDYARTLEHGLWPSLDVLPPAERARTGQPIAEHDVVWAHGG